MMCTAADFHRELDHWAGEETPRVRVLKRALRIAFRVMAEGVIEAAVTQRLNDESSPTDDDLSVAIRAVLLKDAGT